MLSSMLQMSIEMVLLTMRSSSLLCVPQLPLLSTNLEVSTRMLMMSVLLSKGKNKHYLSNISKCNITDLMPMVMELCPEVSWQQL